MKEKCWKCGKMAYDIIRYSVPEYNLSGQQICPECWEKDKEKYHHPDQRKNENMLETFAQDIEDFLHNAHRMMMVQFNVVEKIAFENGLAYLTERDSKWERVCLNIAKTLDEIPILVDRQRKIK